MKNRNVSHFRDIHVHAANIQEWNQDYNQLTAGLAESSLMQLTTARCHVFREQINQRVVQHGVAPRGKMCFAVPITVPGSTRMQGREVDDSSLFFLQGGEEFMFHMPMGMELLSITFEREWFEQALAQTPSAKEISQLLRQPVIRVSSQRFAHARRQLLAVFSQALAHEELDSAGDPALEQAMLGELLQLMIDPACDKHQRIASSTRSFIVEKCHRLTTAQVLNVPSVDELCQRLHVSRRTVQNSFRSVAETTPLNYLRSVRLNGVRRTLMSTPASHLSIGDAAAQWGFYHLSHFAAEYQELFAELPSHTARAAIPGCAHA
ncbi:helix-turn-helix domain-containing protein [Pseudomonas fluorescens]|uniref:Helix-turn-helix domain-containing protein n=1 Tax=Pseudomonas fluorescens TaxID=294 RepID=A0A944DKH6_PSEFL|nr:helix-turn-helix domain-containing protein [Pseudomonas fluorescens]MBT2297438.1 helix-turn-helix domain-containing protein [Pseudomonas fluorescens]MBT2305636.1 helix-turn-helix domain-containing protein [Pseudomonas fluorescens]MBT2314341.1 helix-turn-helix domain-containing protein [Pseudomonas fluorescens]MBT2319167.1 helix-turn-helix domain-containing protein [Pseudomonas fluorescens]MBT2328560.1 helix-turn-helix domain-containing protein [Pseudomonas fluorescens]